jgi:cystathionine beta-lyase/cystathionine gamma-synthase
MRSGGGMLAFELAGGLAAAAAVVDRLELFRIIPSLGGVESGASLPALTSHRRLTAARRAELGIGDGLVRLSVGIEGYEDLEADLAQALRVQRGEGASPSPLEGGKGIEGMRG